MSSSPSSPIPVLPYQCMNNFNQEVARTILRKVSATLSIIGSCYVLRLIYTKYRSTSSLHGGTASNSNNDNNRNKVDSYHRIMAGLCLYDILFSLFWWFMGSWMTPRDTGWWGARYGNTVSCMIQGAVTDFALIGIWSYQTLLSLFMLLLVTYGWSPTKFEQCIELHIHPIILAGAIIYIIPPLIYQGYNPECGHCAPVPLPMNCGYWIFGSAHEEEVVECIRGSATLAYVYWIIFFILLPFVTIFCSTAMYVVYHTVRTQEERRSSIRSFHEDHHRESKRIRKTMVLYTSSFYLCWIVPTIFLWVPHTVATLKIIGDLLMPLQGLFTMLVFIQPKCIKYQHTYPGTSLLGAYFCVLFKPEKFQAVLRRLSSTTGDRPVSPLSNEFDNTNDDDDDDDDEDIGFSHRIRVAIRRLSITTARRTGGGSGRGGENPYVDGDGIGFQDYNSDQRRSSSISNDDNELRLSMMSNETDGDDEKVAGMKRNSSAETEDVTLYSPRTTTSSSSEGPA